MHRTLAILLALLAFAALAAACPRDKGEQTTISIEEEVPGATSVVDGDGAEGGTDIDVDITQEGDTTDTDAGAEGEATDGETTEGDAAANGEDTAGEAGEDTPAEPAKEDPSVVTVVFETTKGDIVMEVHPDWAPIGAARFLELVNANYYSNAPWFRVIPGFVAQTGIAADPAVSAQWMDKHLQDDPVKQGNKKGMVAYAMAGPGTRSTQFFINFVDNSISLDRQGFAAFAEVVKGMDVAEKLTACEVHDQGALRERGIDFFKSQCPNGDTTVRAYVKE